jgi:hypothetical protein
MNFLRLAGSAVLVLATCGGFALCDEPATRPANNAPTTNAPAADAPAANEPATRPDTEVRGATAGDIRQAWRTALGFGRTSNIRPYTAAEWDDMMAFLKVNSPARYTVVNSLNLPANSPIRLDLIRKWRNYIFVKEHFPAISENYVKRFRLEDELFLLVMKAKRSGETTSNDLHVRIRDKVAQLVELGFDERQLRIAKLEELLDQEKKKLAEDQDKKETVIDQRTDAIMARLQHLNAPGRRGSPSTRPARAGDGTAALTTSTDAPAVEGKGDAGTGGGDGNGSGTVPGGGFVDAKDQTHPAGAAPAPANGAGAPDDSN